MRADRRERYDQAVIASKGNDLRALSDEALAAAVETIRAFSSARERTDTHARGRSFETRE